MSDATNSLKFPEIDTAMVQTLMEIGYVAIGRGQQSAAEDIFNGISSARPESELPIIGLAVTKMNFGDFTAAFKLLGENALSINPESDLAKCFLGVVSFYCGAQKESLAIMSDILANSSDEVAIKIAKSTLEEINK